MRQQPMTWKRARRQAAREGEPIILHINALLSAAAGDRFTLVCRDGFRATVIFDKAAVQTRTEITELGIRVDPECGEALRSEWPDVLNPARGLFLRVPAGEIVYLVWTHGGVDMAASRAATRAMDGAGGDRNA